MSDRQVHVIVKGLVQGVFFRKSTLEEAARRGLRGSVRNLPDRSVEIVARGPADQIEALLAWARRGPPSARVDTLEITDVELDDALGPFQIER